MFLLHVSLCGILLSMCTHSSMFWSFLLLRGHSHTLLTPHKSYLIFYSFPLLFKCTAYVGRSLRNVHRTLPFTSNLSLTEKKWMSFFHVESNIYFLAKTIRYFSTLLCNKLGISMINTVFKKEFTRSYTLSWNNRVINYLNWFQSNLPLAKKKRLVKYCIGSVHVNANVGIF